MFSELVAVSSKGELYQWKWSEPEPYRNPQVKNSTCVNSDMFGLAKKESCYRACITDFLSFVTLESCCSSPTCILLGPG